MYVEDEAEDVLAENGVSPTHVFRSVYVIVGNTFQTVCLILFSHRLEFNFSFESRA